MCEECSKLGGLLTFCEANVTGNSNVSFTYDTLNSVLFKIIVKDHNSQTQQCFYSVLLTFYNIMEEIKSRLRLGNACYHSVQNLLSSRLLSKNLKIKIYRTIILPVLLCECETRSLTMREERKLRVFENMVLRRIFGPRRDEVTGNGGDCITRS